MSRRTGFAIALCLIIGGLSLCSSASTIWAQGKNSFLLKTIADQASTDAIDNSTSTAFPPIRDQGAISSCTGWATTYYQFTYENNHARGLKASGGNNNVIFSPKWTYNMINQGLNQDSDISKAYDLLSKNGAATWADFPYSSDATVSTNYTEWCLDADTWRKAIDFRLKSTETITHTSDADVDTFIDSLKSWLADKHVIVFLTFSKSWVKTKISDNPSTEGTDAHTDEYIAGYMNNTAIDYHAMTIVGYDDSIWCDLNENDTVEDGERGAFKVANSRGTSGDNSWNKGFRWVSYDALRETSAVSDWDNSDRDSRGIFLRKGYTATAYSSYTPTLVAELTLNHALRNQMSVSLGCGGDNSTRPSSTWTSAAINYSGGNLAFDGSTTACDGTFYFDFTDLAENHSDAKRWFAIISDNNQDDHPASITSFKLYRVEDSEDTLVASNTDNQTVDDGKKYVWVDYSLESPILTPPEVTTNAATDISGSGATLSGSLTDTGTASEVQVSFEWGTSTSYGNSTESQTLSSTSDFSADISGLNSFTTYHYRSKAVGDDTVYGADATFKTLPTGPDPIVSTKAARNITATTATLNGQLDYLGEAKSVAVSFDYGTTTSYGSTTGYQDLTLPGSFSSAAESLAPNTTYHFRAKAAGISTVYGTDYTLITLTMPLGVETQKASGIGKIAATLNGNLTGMGKDESVEVYFQWGTASGTYENTTGYISMAATGTFSTKLISGLTSGKTYYFRAAVSGSDGIVYGPEISFNTKKQTSSGGGGGGGSAQTAVKSTLLSLSGLTSSSTPILGEKGTLQSQALIQNKNGDVILNIAKGTLLTDANGVALKILSVDVPPDIQSTPPNTWILMDYNLGPEGAKFNPPLTLTLKYDPIKLPAGTSESQIYIAFRDGSNWIKLDSLVDQTAHSVSAAVAHFSHYALLAPVSQSSPASFSLSDLTVSPTEVTPDSPVTVQALISNTGGTSGTYHVSLEVNGIEEMQQEVSLEAGQTQNLTFQLKKTDPGDYTLAINDKTISFKVISPLSSPAPLPSVEIPTAVIISAPVLPQSPPTQTNSNLTIPAMWLLLVPAAILICIWLIFAVRTEKKPHRDKETKT